MLVELLVFEIADSVFGIPTAYVRGVVRAVALFPLPEHPGAIEGGFNLRGEIVPVINGRALFAGAQRPMHPRDHLIVLERHGCVVAVHVDCALELAVVDSSGDETESVPGHFVQYVVNTPRGATSVLDVDALLRFGHAAEASVTSGTGGEP